MGEPEFDREREAQQFKEVAEAEQSLDNQAFLLLQKLKLQGVDVPRQVAQAAILLHELDPYPDNLGDRWERKAKPTNTNIPSDDFGSLWYQGRI